jgi:hypothetical protein
MRFMMLLLLLSKTVSPTEKARHRSAVPALGFAQDFCLVRSSESPRFRNEGSATCASISHTDFPPQTLRNEGLPANLIART